MNRLVLLLPLFLLAAACAPCAEETPKDTARKALPEARTGRKYEKPSIQRFWASVEYVATWTKDQPAPGFPLLTVGNITVPGSGALGNPATRELYHPGDTGFGITHGVQARIGAWLDDNRKWGVEAEGFWSPRRRKNTEVVVSPAGNLMVGFPLFDPLANRESFNAFTFPGATVENNYKREQALWSAGLRGVYDFHRGARWDLAASAGFKTVTLEDEYAVRYGITTPGTSLFGVDRIETANKFYGAEFGLRALYHAGRFHAEIAPRLALGANLQDLDIHAAQYLVVGGVTVLAAQGVLFALPGSNIGGHQRTRFGLIPGVDLKAGVDITKRLEFNAGLAFSYWQSVIRASDQLDRRLNITMTAFSPARVGPRVPAVLYDTTDFWSLGLTAGFKVKF